MMTKALTRVLLLSALLVTSVYGDEVANDSSLYSKQMDLLSANRAAWEKLDFEASVQILRELRQVTAERRDEDRFISVREIEFMLRDIEYASKLPPEQRQTAEEWLKERLKGAEFTNAGDHNTAERHELRALELAESLFEEGSYTIVDSQTAFVRSLLGARDKERYSEGIEMACLARRTMERQQMESFIQYRQLLDPLARLYFNQGRYKEATEAGEISLQLYEVQKDDRSPLYTQLAGIVAECLAEQGEHRKCLEVSRKGLNNNPILPGVFELVRIRLLQQYVRAKLALNETEKEEDAYEEMLALSDKYADTGYPADKRLKHRKDYLDFLKQVGNEQRYQEVLEEVERITQRSPLQKSRFSE